jgi:uncharacterized protein (TIGR03083 family)
MAPQYAELVDAVRREGAALTAAARAAGVDAPVPSCDGWTVADLLSHVGRIHRWVAGIVGAGGEAPAQHWSQTVAPTNDLVEWFAAGVPLLADALERAGADAPAWSWAPTQSTSMWSRRMAHETAVHRWDAQAAAGGCEPIDATLAVDGIDEVFDVLPHRRGAERVVGNGETIHLHATDAPGEWLVTLTPDGPVVTHAHAKGDVAARAGASDLLLFVWGRVGVDAPGFDVFGDAELLSRWQQLARF